MRNPANGFPAPVACWQGLPTANDVIAYPDNEIAELIRRERLPANFKPIVRKYYAPLAADIAKRQTELAQTMIIGINGPQGSGKSTFAKFMALLLSTGSSKRTAIMSLDDFYLTKEQRQKLAQDIHPLLITRGVPGTHDVSLGRSVMASLINAQADSVTMLPCFDKLSDDRCPEAQWTQFIGAPDVILFEGWCVGVHPQPKNALADPVNALERIEDANAVWRRFVNEAIARDYPALFDPIDCLIYLNPPDFECVFEWRRRQEERAAEAAIESGARAMDERALRRFIMHYERLTRFMMEEMPHRADVRIDIDRKQQILRVM